MRKIIQITSSSCSDMNGSDIYSLSALCNDGTVWEYLHGTNSWFKLSDIPQDPPIELPEEELKNKQGSDRWNELLSQCNPSIKTEVKFTGIKDIDLNESSRTGINRTQGYSFNKQTKDK